MKRKLIALLTLALIVITSYGQSISEHEVSQRVDNYLTEIGNIGFFGSAVVELNGKLSAKKNFWNRFYHQTLGLKQVQVFHIPMSGTVY